MGDGSERTWRESVAERGRLAGLLRVGGAGPLAGALAASTAVAASAPAISGATGWFVDAVGSAGALPQVAVPLAVLIGLLVASQLAQSLAQITTQLVALRVDGAVRRRARAAALGPADMAHLEDPVFQTDLTRACDLGDRWRLRSVGAAAAGQIVLGFRVAGAVASAVVLALWFPLLALGLLVVSVVTRDLITRDWLRNTEADDARVPEERRKEYWSELAAGTEAAKEIRLYGLAGWVMSRRHAAQYEWWTPLWEARRGTLRRQWVTTLLAAGSGLAALLVPGLAAARGELGTGELATCLVAAWGVFGIGFMGMEAFDIQYGLGALRALERLELGPRSAVLALPAPRAAEGAAPPEVRCEGLRFAYPGSAREEVLRGLDLRIAPGEVLGVVGVNGAGKTTLIKLLAGLHRPTGGRVTVDGTDLAELDAAAWRRQLAVVFQDFVHYPASVRDNVALSAPERPLDADRLARALRAAGADGLVADLPDGLDTGLWRGGSADTDLSGGQWQKLAIARALYAVASGRRILVLDEPTAHLDVTAEAAFFDRTVEAVDGRASVVLISHRLSTLRAAHRIAVVDGGRVAETGSHDELMAADGVYARLFRLQAGRFETDATRGTLRKEAAR